MFKTKEREIDYLPLLTGSYNEIEVTLKNIPYKKELLGGKKNLPSDSFSCELYEHLVSNKLKNFSHIKEHLKTNGVVKAIVELAGFDDIMIELKAKRIIDEKVFYHDVGEAINDAFTRSGIKL